MLKSKRKCRISSVQNIASKELCPKVECECRVSNAENVTKKKYFCRKDKRKYRVLKTLQERIMSKGRRPIIEC
jgi:hypothetical protein